MWVNQKTGNLSYPIKIGAADFVMLRITIIRRCAPPSSERKADDTHEALV